MPGVADDRKYSRRIIPCAKTSDPDARTVQVHVLHCWLSKENPDAFRSGIPLHLRQETARFIRCPSVVHDGCKVWRLDWNAKRKLQMSISSTDSPTLNCTKKFCRTSHINDKHLDRAGLIITWEKHAYAAANHSIPSEMAFLFVASFWQWFLSTKTFTARIEHMF